MPFLFRKPGELLPSLGIEFKNSDGEVVELDDAIVTRNGSELKVWQTVAEYALSFSEAGEVGSIPDVYEQSDNRLIQVDARSLWFWPLAGIILLVGGLSALLYRKRRGGASQPI